jgi:outer membrane protein assembly factor BamB
MRSARERWHRVAVLALIVSSGCGEEEPTGAAPDAGPPAASTCWSFTGPMHQRRVGADAVVLADGRVLVVGGYDVAAHASAEVYDSTSGVWTEVAPMHSARVFPAAVLLEDGRVLVAGGYAAAEPGSVGQASAELFDPVTGTWSLVAPMRRARPSPKGYRLADGRVFIAGGDRVYELYDPGSATWRELSLPPTEGQIAWPALVPDGRLFFTGSQDSFYFDPSSETWQRRAPKLGTEGGVHVALRDGRILSPWSAGTARQPGRVGGPLAPIAFGPGFG